MKPAKLLTISLLVLLTSPLAYSIDTNAVKYYPLKVGNYWVYNFWWGWNGSNTRIWLKVVDTLIANGHKYYKVRSGMNDEFIRIDSAVGSVRKYVTSGSCPWLTNELTRDSLSARFRDSSKFECNLYYRCIDDSSLVTIFGQTKPQKVFSWTDYFEHTRSRAFARDIGLIRDYYYGPDPGTWTRLDLLGCIINGILYGDTSLTGISPISSEVPYKFSLYQNYPNPFNQSSIINYQLPISTFVELMVHDILGREIETLVNEELKPGIYEVNFDGTNYPSGVYYYTLIAGDYKETKKMILVK